MAGRYKAYPAYKDSGVEWLGEIPEGWKTVALKYVSYIQTGFAFNSDDFVSHGIPVIRIGDINSDGNVSLSNCKYVSKNTYDLTHKAYEVKRNDMLMAMTGATVGKLGKFIDDGKAFINQRVCVFKLFEENILSCFYWYLVQSLGYQKYISLTAFGGAQPNISDTELLDFKTALPKIAEQQKIAQFLDYETAKIDALIAKQEQLIELLKEKRQAVISHAVTKGLNPDAPMKDSGVEWLGQVPEHWIICALKRKLVSLNFRRIPLSSEERSYKRGEFPYYGASGIIDYIDEYIFDEPTVLVGEDGANLLSRSTPLAFSAYGKYWVNNHAHIFSSKDKLMDYWAEVIEHIDVTPIVSGSAQPKLTAESINNLKVAFPSDLEERVLIDFFIKNEKIRYTAVISKSEQQISLLKERKTALISAAVTGKIDVRDWQPPSVG